MANAERDQNSVPTLLAVSSVDGVTPVTVYANPSTHRLLVDGLGNGTVTSVSVATANGFAGTVATATTTPVITLQTTVTGILQGNGTAISAATTTGSGSVVLATSPTLITPILGVATATSLQVNTLTATTNNSINLNSGSYNSIQTYSPAAAGTATLDLSLGNVHFINMPAGNITIAISNASAGQCFIVRIMQDSGGSRTVTWFSNIKWAGGTPPTLTTTANKADMLGFVMTTLTLSDGFVVGQNI